ncbi:MAG: serine/threonine protein kinase, partial [Chitinivibrionales bacterium]|nr:serine/threonine protein kinase [Chitinivibrionales bacterium]MBD3394813.1 serine/threonine protein kinase [Chitinivibrionales bacterium]
FDGIPATLAALVDAARARSRYVLLTDGSTGALPDHWLDVLGGLFAVGGLSPDKNTLVLQPSQLPMAELLQEIAGDAQADDAFRRNMLRLRDSAPAREAVIPGAFRGELRAYQRAGLSWLAFLETAGFGGCLADDMGLGKTVQTLALLAGEKPHRRSRGPSLVVAPTSVLFNWEREAKCFAPQLLVMTYHGAHRRRYGRKDFELADVVLTSYGTALRDRDMLASVRFDYVVLDEAQAIKNPSAKMSRMVRELDARRRLALTGTPVENSLTELWSLFAFLNPGMLGTYRGFVRAFAAPIQREDNTDIAEILRRLVAPFVLRRTKKQVATDLPPKTEDVFRVEMTARQRSLYDTTRDLYRTRVATAIDRHGLEASRMQVLEALLRLRQICCHPLLFDPSYGGDSAKFVLLDDFLAQTIQEDHRVLVFSQFVRALELVKARLAGQGTACEMLTGKSRDRRAIVDRFQSPRGAPVFLVSLKAGGVGLNLTAADYVVHLDPWWNPSVEDQASDRAHRIGQKRPVFVYRLLTVRSVEEQVAELQARKREVIGRIVREEDSFFKHLRPEDIMGLFEDR